MLPHRAVWILALGLVSCSPGRPRARATPAPAGLRLAIGFGVDTGTSGGDFTIAGQATRPSREVFLLWRAYLSDRPDSLHPSPYWSAAEQRTGEEYDFTRGAVYQSPRWFESFRPTVVSIAPTAPGVEDEYVIRTLFASTSGTGDIRPLALLRMYAIRESGRWVLASALPRMTRTWVRQRVGRLTYVVAPGHRFDEARAARANRFVDSIVTLFEAPPPDSITYYVADTADETERVLGLEYSVGVVGGRALGRAALVSGNPLVGEFYAHELAHVVLAPIITPGAHPFMVEGAATWLGGSLGKDLPTLLRDYASFLRGRSDVTFTSLFAGSFNEDVGYRPLGAVAIQLAFERGGIAAVKSLLATPATGYPALRELLERVIGRRGIDLDSAIRARALQYDPAR